jgi:hypothetical protein
MVIDFHFDLKDQQGDVQVEENDQEVLTGCLVTKSRVVKSKLRDAYK